MNLSVSLSAAQLSSAVHLTKACSSDQMMSRRKIGYAVLPARISRPMVTRTKYESWNGIMLASSSDMPELLKAEAPLKTPSHHGLMPLRSGGSGRWVLIQAPSATQPSSCQSTK